MSIVIGVNVFDTPTLPVDRSRDKDSVSRSLTERNPVHRLPVVSVLILCPEIVRSITRKKMSKIPGQAWETGSVNVSWYLDTSITLSKESLVFWLETLRVPDTERVSASPTSTTLTLISGSGTEGRVTRKLVCERKKQLPTRNPPKIEYWISRGTWVNVLGEKEHSIDNSLCVKIHHYHGLHPPFLYVTNRGIGTIFRHWTPWRHPDPKCFAPVN